MKSSYQYQLMLKYNFCSNTALVLVLWCENNLKNKLEDDLKLLENCVELLLTRTINVKMPLWYEDELNWKINSNFLKKGFVQFLLFHCYSRWVVEWWLGGRLEELSSNPIEFAC